MKQTRNKWRPVALSFVQQQPFLTLATCSRAGEPHSSVLLYDIDDDFTIYTVTHQETYKVNQLLDNPVVAGSIYEIGNAYVQFHGVVKLVKSNAQILKIYTRLAAKATEVKKFWPPIFKFPGQDYLVFSIKPTWLRYMPIKSKVITEKRPPMPDIISSKKHSIKIKHY
jgi:general stress protein 26